MLSLVLNVLIRKKTENMIIAGLVWKPSSNEHIHATS